jgi:hypothetical protein
MVLNWGLLYEERRENRIQSRAKICYLPSPAQSFLVSVPPGPKTKIFVRSKTIYVF